ncbi:MAG: hypothetical protein ACI4T2_02195 [Christensenellales bacterium]
MGKIEKKRNVLKIINDATYILGDAWGQMICATALAMVSVFAWILFAPFGIVLMVFATGFISLGYIRFTIDILKQKNPNVEKVYGNYKQCFSAFALRIVMCVITALWSLLLIVPGVVCALNYSFAMSVMCEDKNMTAFRAIEKSKQLVKGYRLEILDIYLLWFLMIAVVFGGFTSLVAGIGVAAGGIETWLVFTLGALITVCIDILILMPFKQICLTSIYLDAKESQKSVKKTPAKDTQTVEVAA